MKNIHCNDILSINSNEQQIVINKIRELMNEKYPSFISWFDDKLVPGIENGERNIIYIENDKEIIAFANLTNKKNEKKISNIYIKPVFKYKAYFNIMIDKALEWLETQRPIIIVSEKELYRCTDLILNRDWHFTDMNKNGDFIVNRIPPIENMIKKR